MIQTFGETCYLDIQYLLATIGHIIVLGDKRMRIDLTQQLKLFRSNRLTYDLVGVRMALGIDKCRVHTSFGTQFLDVYLTHLQLRLE